MDIFELENDLPDEIMASTSQPGSSVTRNTFRVIPTSDGSDRLRLRIRVEPMPSTSESTQSNQSLSTTTSSQTATSSSSSFLPQSAINLSMPQTLSTLTTASSSANYLPQSQNIQSVNPMETTQAAPASWFSNQTQHNAVTYNAALSQPVDMSSSFLSQSQNNQYIHPTTIPLLPGVDPHLLPSSSKQTAFPSTSSQSMGMSSTSFLQPSQINRASIFSPRVSTKQCFYSHLNPLTSSRSSNQSPYAIFSPFIPNYNPTTPRYNGPQPSMAPNSPRYNGPTTSTLYDPQFPSMSSSHQPRTMERKIADMKRRWMGDHERLTLRNPQATSSVTQAHPTTSSTLPQSATQNVQAIVAGLKNLENTVAKTPAVSETSFGQQSQNRENQIAMNLVQNAPNANNASSSNKNLTGNTHQNVTKEWQKEINIELREHLVRNIVQTLATVPSSATQAFVPSNAAQALKSYIEKTEREVYETANSKDEYYRLLAEKFHKIQKGIEKKSQEKKEQLQQLQQLQELQQQLQQQTQQSQNLQNDVEMSLIQSRNEVARPLDSNSNIAESQPTNITSGASHILSFTSIDKRKNGTKEWHKQIGAELREILVKEFVQRMVPVSGTEAVINNLEESTISERIKSYAKNVECDIYQKADSRIEYYDQLADKYCKIQDELRKGNFAALDSLDSS